MWWWVLGANRKESRWGVVLGGWFGGLGRGFGWVNGWVDEWMSEWKLGRGWVFLVPRMDANVCMNE